MAFRPTMKQKTIVEQHNRHMERYRERYRGIELINRSRKSCLYRGWTLSANVGGRWTMNFCQPDVKISMLPAVWRKEKRCFGHEVFFKPLALKGSCQKRCFFLSTARSIDLSLSIYHNLFLSHGSWDTFLIIGVRKFIVQINRMKIRQKFLT